MSNKEAMDLILKIGKLSTLVGYRYEAREAELLYSARKRIDDAYVITDSCKNGLRLLFGKLKVMEVNLRIKRKKYDTSI